MTNPRIIPPGEVLLPRVPLRKRTPQPPQTTRNKPKRSAGKRAAAVRQRFGLLNDVVDRGLPLMKRRAALAVWLVLYRVAGPSGIATAAVSDLSRRTGCCEATVRRALKRLIACGLVERVKRGSLAGGPSVYRLLPPPPTP